MRQDRFLGGSWVVAGVMASSALLAANSCSNSSNGTGGGAGSGGHQTHTTGSHTGSSVMDASATDGGSVARGKYLVDHVAACGDCHTPRNADGSPDMTKYLAGNPGLFQVPGLGPDGGVGIVSPKNLTPDKITGLGNWTDSQIMTAFLDGTDDEGVALFPIMPYYVFHNMTPADAQAIVDYLRSIPAVSNTVPDKNFTIPAPSPGFPAASIPTPTLASSDPKYASALRGKYLAGSIGICMECHTEHVATPGAVPLDTTKLFAGGEQFGRADLGLPPIFPVVIYSANLTPDSTGLQTWAAADIVNALASGVHKGGAPICPPMPAGPKGAFGGLTDGDKTDLANYLLALPPIANTVPECVISSPDAGPTGDAGQGDAGDAGP